MSEVEASFSSRIGAGHALLAPSTREADVAVRGLRAVPTGCSTNSPVQAEIVWRRTLELAESFDQNHLFAVVLELLRVARYDLVTMVDAQVLGRTRMAKEPIDLVARRALGLLGRAIAFLGGANSSGRGRSMRSGHTGPLSRLGTMSKEALA